MKTDILPDNVSDKEAVEEANRRASRCGVCTRYGEPPYRTKIMVTVPFGETKIKSWPRDKNGDLIE